MCTKIMWLKNHIASAFLSSKNHDKDLIALTRKKKNDLCKLHGSFNASFCLKAPEALTTK